MPKGVLTQGVVHDAGACTAGGREVPGSLWQSHWDPKCRVSSEQPLHANETGTADTTLKG